MKLRSHLSIMLLAAVVCITSACRHQESARGSGYDFDSFVPAYNSYIRKWLQAKQDAIREKERQLAEVDVNSKRSELEEELKLLKEDEPKWQFRLGLGDYLKFSSPSEVPADLIWENGMSEPEIGDPAAKKGGVFHRFINTFPPTIRPFGENSNNSFRGDLYDLIDLPLVALHPDTMNMIPGIAREWAVSPDGRTTYFRIHPEARYSTGKPVRAKDFLVQVYVQASDNVVNPSAKQYYRDEIAQFCVYDDLTLSVTLPEARYLAPARAGAVTPASPDFYAQYGPDYATRYQWKYVPTTGAYEVLPEDVVKGVSITQTRVKNWWAREMKYYQYRFNPDKIVHTVVRDESKAFELFRAGQIDTAYLTLPKYWYEKSEIPPVYDGYIERHVFYKRYPKIPRGIYPNVSKPPLDNSDVRVGIDYSLHWRKVIDVLFRGDAGRLNSMNEGYAVFSDPGLKARPYSVSKARAAFARAGYTREDNQGYLLNQANQRLSIPVTYVSMPEYDSMFAILREDAKACGLDLRLDALEATVAYKKEMLKQHSLAFGGWLITPPTPDYYQFFHSSTANRPQTNNLNNWARADTDALCEQVRNARTQQDLKDAAWKLQHIIHDEALFMPSFSVDFSRIGSWRWVRWPDSPNTRFSPPVVYDPHETFCFWIDEDLRKETLAAMRVGKSFPEVLEVHDEYRDESSTVPPSPATGEAAGDAPTENPKAPEN